MPVNLDGQLVVAISSRALFDFEEENKVFEQSDDRAYMKLQLERLEEPAKPGVAFSLVKKLLAFNDANAINGKAANTAMCSLDFVKFTLITPVLRFIRLQLILHIYAKCMPK